MNNVNDYVEKGQYVIVRAKFAGVFAGEFDGVNENICFLKNSRRIFWWEGAASISQLAVSGTSKPDDCKFPEIEEKKVINEWIEIIPCTKKAEESIKNVPIWKC